MELFWRFEEGDSLLEAMKVLEGMRIPEEAFLGLEQIQELGLSLLLEFDQLCEEGGIRYSLCGGSMLGAARHEGFIPWDDDVDVMMLRDEYEKLLALPIDRLPEDRQIVSCRDGSYCRDFARYVHLGYGRVEPDTDDSDCLLYGIDVFPIDFVPKADGPYLKQVRDHKFWRNVMLVCSSAYGTGSSFAKCFVKDILRPAARAYGCLRAACKGEEVCMRYTQSSREDGFIAIVCGMYGARERWPYALYEPLVRVPFEGRMLCAPHGYKDYLSSIYGDYMRLPPLEKRRPNHCLRVWDKKRFDDGLLQH